MDALVATRRARLAALAAAYSGRVTAEVNRVGGPLGRRGAAVPRGGIIASYLKLSPRELRSRLRSGQSLAQVAASSGKSVTGLIEAIVAARKSTLAAAVAAGTLTPAQSAAIQAHLSERVTARVDKPLHKTPLG